MDQLEQDAANMIVTASFIYDSASQPGSVGGSVAEQDFDSESSVDLEELPQHRDRDSLSSLAKRSTTSVDVEVHRYDDHDDHVAQRPSLRSFPTSKNADEDFWLPNESSAVKVYPHKVPE